MPIAKPVPQAKVAVVAAKPVRTRVRAAAKRKVAAQKPIQKPGSAHEELYQK